MSGSPQMSQQQIAAQLRMMNMNARNYIANQCPEDTQQIYSQVIAGGQAASGVVVNINPKNVGLITGFLVFVDVDVVVPAGINLTRNKVGAANLLSKVEFVDLSNLTRINTSGWHLAAINTVRSRGPAGAAYTTDTPLGYGSNVFAGINIPPTIAAGATQRVSMAYHVPLAYSRDDLRGAVYAGVVNATMQLNLTVNPAVSAFGTDTVTSVYNQDAAGAVAAQNCKITVYQIFYDQLPLGQNGPGLPTDDLTTSYQLKSTNLNGLAVGQDFPLPFSNFNDFYSTTVVFDNGGQLNPGTDINNFQHLTANASQLWKFEPRVLAYRNRTMLSVDTPTGMYYFEHRRRPISTLQYGNQQLVVNPSVVNTGAQLLIGYEMMTKQGVVSASGSLPGG